MQYKSVPKVVALVVLSWITDQCCGDSTIDKNHTLAAKIGIFQRSFNARVANSWLTPPSGLFEGGSLQVYVYLHLLEQFAIDTYEQTVTLSMVLCMQWTDSRLTWETESSPTNTVYARYSIWSPRIRFINVVKADSATYSPPQVENTGSVVKCRLYNIIAPCSFDLSEFPNDVHNCSLSFTSVHYGTNNITFSVWITESETASSEWKVAPLLVERDLPKVELELQLTRKPHLYGTRVYLGLWTSLFLLAFILLGPEKHRIQLSYILLLAASLQHGFIFTMVRGSTGTPRILLHSSAIVVTCLAMLCSSQLKFVLRRKDVSPREEALEVVLATFDKFVFLPVIGLLVIILLFQ